MSARARGGAQSASEILQNLQRFQWVDRDIRAPVWCREELAGRLTEVSGSGGTAGGFTAATTLLLEAQAAGEPCAWLSRRESTFFPPDLARSGVDLEALVVVFVPSAGAAARSAARLVRSGAFGLLVLDLGPSPAIAIALQGRLARLAQAHDAAVVLLTEKDAAAPSVGSMVSLRMEASRAREGEARFRLRLTALKDKRRGPGWTHEEVVDGPAGLR